MVTRTTKATADRRVTHYRRLDRAIYAVVSDLVDHCDKVCEQAEQRLGTTDMDIIITDPAYTAALNLFSEIHDIKTRIATFRSIWIGDD